MINVNPSQNVSPSYSSFIPKAMIQNMNSMLMANSKPQQSLGSALNSAFAQPSQMQIPIRSIPNQQTKNSELSNAIKKIDDQNLKYSMDRTCGTTDCSAFTQNVFKDVYGKDIGGYTGSQQNAGTTVTDGNYKDGDLIFTSPDNGKRTGGISHVGIYRDVNGVPSVTDFSSANGGGVRTTPMSEYYKPWKVQRVI